jgi:hypothetical protein
MLQASFVVSKLIAPRGASGNSQQEDSVTGSRVQLPPATNNKLPVVYGTAFVGGSITDAKISTDLQTMWYVLSMAEVTNTMPGDTPDTLTFDELYYDGKLVALSGAQVTSLSTNTAGGAEVDTKINGQLFMYLFPNGSFSGTNTGGQSAITIMSDAAIPSDQRWNQGIYTASGQSAAMTNTAFVIVKVIYNSDAGTTSLGAVTAKLTNSRTKPGDCITDYLLNDRYGCAVPLAGIDTASMTALNTYSDKPIVYTPMGGGATTTQVRYRFNGPVDTTSNCLSNLQDMVDACDSWMQYSELTGKWKVVINKAYDETPDALTFDDLYSVTSNNLTSGIQVNPTDLNQTFNQVEYQYPNTNIKDQLDFIFISLQDDLPGLLSENEPINKLGLKNDLVNNYVQAKFIAIRRLLQGREDLIITLRTDYSGIQVEAGDVIRVTNETYGWTDKLFRVSNVVEEKDADGNLFASLTGFEYNETIYDDDLDITDFIPADNTGLQDPNIISQPDAPIVLANTNTTLNFLNISGNVPNVGLVLNLDFNYGFDSNTANHLYYTTVNNSNGAPLIPSSNYTINVNDIEQSGNIFWSTTARNRQVGIQSNASTSTSWAGANVSVYDPGSNTGGISGNNVASNSITYVNLAPQAAAKQYSVGWSMTTPVPPAPLFEDGTARTDYLYPFYLDGVTIANTAYDPWAQNTASTTDGFLANSTSPYEPNLASQKVQVVNTDGWVIITFLDWLFDPITSSEVIDESINLSFLSDDPSVRLQICPIVVFSTTPSGSFQLSTQLQNDIELSPTYYGNDQFKGLFYSSRSLTTTGAPIEITGYALRNLTPTSTVYVTNCIYRGSQRKA